MRLVIDIETSTQGKPPTEEDCGVVERFMKNMLDDILYDPPPSDHPKAIKNDEGEKIGFWYWTLFH